MDRAYTFLLFIFFLGLLLIAFLGSVKSRRIRRIVFWASLVLINTGTLVILFAVYAVSRLNGSIPPGLGTIIRPLAVPVLLIGLSDMVLVFLNRRVKRRTG
jgi:hypothetical protein